MRSMLIIVLLALMPFAFFAEATTTKEQAICMTRCTTDYNACLGIAGPLYGNIMTTGLCQANKNYCNSNCAPVTAATGSRREIALAKELTHAATQHITLTREFAIAMLGFNLLNTTTTGAGGAFAQALKYDSTGGDPPINATLPGDLINAFLNDNLATFRDLISPFIDNEPKFTPSVATDHNNKCPPIISTYSDLGLKTCYYPNMTSVFPVYPRQNVSFIANYPYSKLQNSVQLYDLAVDHVRIVFSLLFSIVQANYNLSDPVVSKWAHEWEYQADWITEFIVSFADRNDELATRQAATSCIKYHTSQTIVEVAYFIQAVQSTVPATIVNNLSQSRATYNSLVYEAEGCMEELAHALMIMN